MTERARPRRANTLFAQVLGLVAFTLIAAQAINLSLLYTVRPPIPPVYRISEVAAALQGREMNFSRRPPLRRYVQDAAPSPVSQSRRTPFVRSALGDALGVPAADIVLAYPNSADAVRPVEAQPWPATENDHLLLSPFEVGLKRADGRWLVVRPERPPGLSPWQQQVLLWFLLSTLVTAPIAYAFSRRLAAPIRRFAEAAAQLGRAPQGPALVVEGPAEIREATWAFNEMQERLRRYVEDRTAIVGAIAHDLRTPLTRLRFRIESAPDELRAKITADVDQMEEMVAAALSFVRDASGAGPRSRLELSSMLESLCDEMAETGADLEVSRAETVVLEGDHLALRRLFTNLLENAVKFGDRARVQVFAEDGRAVVEIDDDGPGIPHDEADKVFEPFYRRERSRSRRTGGAGLGLAVVRSVVRAHAGEVALLNRDGGGMTARVELPL